MHRASVAFAALVASLAVACGERPPPNDSTNGPRFVDPPIVDKQSLIPLEYEAWNAGREPDPGLAAREPAYYFQRTVLGQSPIDAFSGMSHAGPLRIVRFEVHEDLLIARGAPEDSRSAADTAPIGVFRVVAHFDPAGDAGTCDASGCAARADDRPWFQRRYMRIDWSRNLVEHIDTQFEADTIPSLRSESMSAGVVGEDDPLAPRFERDLSRFDFIERSVVHPELTVVPSLAGSTRDLCSVFDRDRVRSCGPVQLTSRLAFRRIDPVGEMRPTIVGVTDPSAYDGRFSTTRASVRRSSAGVPFEVAARVDLFERDHAIATGTPTSTGCNRDADCPGETVCAIASSPRDAARRGSCAPVALLHVPDDASRACSRDSDCRDGGANAMSGTAQCDLATHTCGEPYRRCATDLDCAGREPGAFCDRSVATVRSDAQGLCTAPLRARSVRPIAIHLTQGVPDDIVPGIARSITSWNASFREAIVRARRRECQIEHEIDAANPTSDTEPTCNAAAVTGLDEALGADARFVVVGCHAPVWGTATGAGSHSTSDVDAAHASGWDLPVCGAQGTVARAGDLGALTVDVANAGDRSDNAWVSLAADPIDGHIVAGRIVLSATRLDDGASLLRQFSLAAAGRDTPFATRPPLALDAAFHAPGAAERLRTVHTILDDIAPNAVGFDLLNTGLFGDGSGNAEARFMTLASSSLGRATIGGWREWLTPLDSGLDDLASGALVSPFDGESVAARRIRERLQVEQGQAECGLRYEPGDLALDPIIARVTAVSQPTCTDDASLCVDGALPWVTQSSVPADDVLRRYFRNYLVAAAMQHELGHLLGLPHNLAGSADALNYPDRYWAHRADGHPDGIVPRYTSLTHPADGSYASAAEDRVANDHVTASVMDLLEPFVAAHGPARSDHAAIASLYTESVDALRAVIDPAALDQWDDGSRGGWQFDLSGWVSGDVRRTHYTRVPSIVGRAPGGTVRLRDEDRFTVLASETTTESVTGWGTPRLSNRTTHGESLVRYLHASERDGLNGWPTVAYDRGADAFESVHALATRWNDGRTYELDATSTTMFSALDRVRRRFVEPMRISVRSSMLQAAALTSVSGLRISTSHPEDMVERAAATFAMNTFLGMLTAPSGGTFEDTFALDGSRRFEVDYANNRGSAIVSLLSPSQRADGSLLGVGGWPDRQAALEGLMDSDAANSSRPMDNAEADLISYFPDAALRWLGGVLADDLVDAGPHVDLATSAPRTPNGVDVLALQGTDPSPGDPMSIPIASGLDANSIALVMAHAVARWSVLGDRRFVRSAAVWTDDQRAVPSQPTVSFDDPWSGRTYRAFHIGTLPGEEGAGVGASRLVHAETNSVAAEAGIAARVILHLRDLDVIRTALAPTDRVASLRIELAMHESLTRLDAIREALRVLGD